MPIKAKLSVHVRAIAVIMLFAMFHYMVGYRFVYSLGILYAKEQAKELIGKQSNKMKELDLTASDYNSLKWTEKGKEFCLNNEMYDVAAVEKYGDNYVFKVYCDNAETGWAASLHNYEKEVFYPDQNAKGTKSAEDVMSSFQKDYAPEAGFKMPLISITGIIHSLPAFQQPSLKIPDPIWHPPYNC